MRVFFRGEFLLAKGQRAAAVGDTAAALVAYDRALAIRPDYAPALLYKAISLSAQQAHEPAAVSAHQAATLVPQRPAYRLIEGMVAYDAGDFPLALACFTQAAHLSPANRLAAAYVLLARIQGGLPRPTSGDLAALDTLMASTNSFFQARWLVLCESALLEHRPEARTLAEQMIAATYTKPPMQGKRSLPGRWRDGLSRCIATLGAVTPARRAALALKRQADARLAAGDPGGALARLAEAVARRPGAEDLLDKYLDLCLDQGEYGPILDWLSASVDVQQLESRPGRFEDQFHLVMLLAIVRFHQGAFDTAAGLLEAAAENDPRDFLPPYFLGVCRLGGNATENARFWFQKAVSIPNPDIARRRLEEWRRCLVVES